MKTINVGVIGTGKHGSRYANHIVHDVAGLALTAVCRRSEEVVAQATDWNCQAYQHWPDLIDDAQVQAVIAVVPPMLNRDIADYASAAGKPLLIEKPLAGNAADAAEIVQLCQERQVPLSVGQTLRYNQVIQRLQKELRHFGTLHSFSANQRLEPSGLAWHEDPAFAGAGVSFHTAVHVIDALRYITGLSVKRVIALAAGKYNQSLEDILAVLIEMENGVIGTIDCSKVCDARSGRFEFVCDRGQLIGEQIYNELTRIEGSTRTPIDTGEPVSTIIPLLEDWHTFLSGEGENPVPGEEGLAAVQFCQASLESAAFGKWISL